ncbi:MAG: hypothetical protein AAB414_03780 [Patescibacteria group bacterium]
MISRLLISKSVEARLEEIQKILKESNLSTNHPDLLYFPYDSKLGIAEARKIKEHFSLKPYSAKGRAVVLEDASLLTHEAQNALLKTLEEPPESAILILAAPSDVKLLPTILSRCQVIRLQTMNHEPITMNYSSDMDKLLTSSIEERFEYIEKLKDRKEFLHALVFYFHQKLASHLTSGNTKFVKELLQAEEWANQNVNIRAILEYLMLVVPSKL